MWIRKEAIQKKLLGYCQWTASKSLVSPLKRSNNWTEASKILSAYKCASYVWCQKIIFSQPESLFQLKQKYYDITWIRIWWRSRSTRCGKSATGCKKLLDMNWQKISPRFIWVMKKDIVNQVWKQSLTQVCFHLENNHAQ